MKNKRGFLLAEETLKIIIAVICIGFLAYLLLSVYQNNAKNKNLDLAKSTLSSISDAINANLTSVDIYNPQGWYLDVWPQDVEEGGIFGTSLNAKLVKGAKPASCKNLDWASCLCICKANTPNDCDNAGTCINNPKNFDIVGKSIELQNLPLTLQINSTKKEISS